MSIRGIGLTLFRIGIIIEPLRTLHKSYAFHVPLSFNLVVGWNTAKGRTAFKILTGKPSEKRLIGMPRRRRDDDTKINIKDIGVNLRNWIYLTQEGSYWLALVNAAQILRFPLAIEFLSIMAKQPPHGICNKKLNKFVMISLCLSESWII